MGAGRDQTSQEAELPPVEGSPRIVVGVDGSKASVRALDWAMDEARQRGAVLEVVTAWMFSRAVGYGLLVTVDQIRDPARQVLDEAVTHVAENAPEVAVRSELIEESPAIALLKASRGADLLVLGSRGLGGFRGLLLGSVGQHCSQHGTCPVVIVRNGDHE